MHCTDAENLKARKVHICSSCGERINAGEKYLRWRCYDSGDVGTVKMHPECRNMHDAEAGATGLWEFTPFSHERPQQRSESA